MQEEWKSIIGYEGLYEVSNKGNVKSLKRAVSVEKKGNSYNKTIEEKIKVPSIDNKGYLRVGLHNSTGRKTFMVHRLVASAFIPNPENKPCINHKDENKTNNNVENLEWCTEWENSIYGNRSRKIGEKVSQVPHTWLYRPVLQYSIKGDFIKEFKSLKEAANTVGAKGYANIQSCCKGRIKSAMGFIWKYKN